MSLGLAGAVGRSPAFAVHAEVAAIERFGAYWKIGARAPGLASSYAAGQFVAVTVGDDLSMPLRRCFSILDADPATGLVEFVVAVYNRGTAWLASRRPGDYLDLLGPLGQPFPPPPGGATSLVVAIGHGGSGLYRLTRDLVRGGGRVHILLGAATSERLFAPAVLTPGAASVTVTTADGSAGMTGTVADPLADLVDQYRPDLAYACGPMAMLRVVSERLADRDVTTYVATEAAMACGIGVCLTCVLPVIGDDGLTQMTRSCWDGPVFRAERIRWADLGTVPGDCWGA